MEQEKEQDFISNNPTTIRLSRDIKHLLKISNIMFYEKSFSGMLNKCIGLYVYQFLQNIEKKDEQILKFCEYCNNKYKREPIIELRIEEKRKLFLIRRIMKDVNLYVNNQFKKKDFVNLLNLYFEESKLYTDNEEVTNKIQEILELTVNNKIIQLRELEEILFKETNEVLIKDGTNTNK